jgi:trigger factor
MCRKAYGFKSRLPHTSTKPRASHQKDFDLKIATQPRDDHQVTLTVEIEPQRMEGAKHRAARRISERTKIPGFRPGKVPYDVALRYLGEEKIAQEALDILLDEVYPEALKEAEIDPSGPGSLDKVESIDPPKFILTVPLMPTIDLGEYHSIRLPYDWKEPGDDKVDEAIEELRRMYSKTETVERPIQAGDFVLVNLKGVKAKAAEGEVQLIDRPGYPVFIRMDAKEDEWPFAGFSSELVGLNKDENKTFDHKYDKDFKDESLRGLTVEFEVTVKMVRGAILPELNDEFAKMTGPFENLQALRDAVRANLVRQSKTDYDDAYFVQLIDKIKEAATIKYPPQMVDHEIEHVTEDLKARLAEQGLDMEAYLKSRQMDEEKFTAEETKPVAIRRLERSLIMEEVTRAEKIVINEEMLNAVFQQTWGEFRASDEFRRAMRGKSNPPKRLLDAVAMESANRAITQQTLTRLKEIATGQAGSAAEEKPKRAPASKKVVGAKTGGGTKKPTPKKASPGKPAASPKRKKSPAK